MKLLKDVLAPSLLSADLARIDGILQQIQYDLPHWNYIMLSDEEGTFLFPSQQAWPPAESNRIVRLENDLFIKDKKLGTLVVYADMTDFLEHKIEHVEHLEMWLFILMLLTGSIFLWLQNRLVLHPLERLSRAANRLAEGDFEAELPMVTHDEMGSLVDAFSMMRKNRQSIEAELISKQKHIQLGQEYGNIGFWEWDIQTGKLNWSERIFKFFGWNEKDGNVNFDMFIGSVHPDDREMMALRSADCVDNDKRYSIDYRIFWADGSMHWLHAEGNVERDADGVPLRMLGVIYDVSSSKSKEEELQITKNIAEQNSLELSGFLQAIDQQALLVVTDVAGLIIQANTRYCDVSNYSLKELLGQNQQHVISNEYTNDIYIELWAAISHGEIWRGELCNRAKNGTLFWSNTAIVPMKDVQGKIYRYIWVGIDITRHKDIERELSMLNTSLESQIESRTEQLKRAMKHAEAANQAKSAFLSNMSHEIRTPMNSIIGMAYLALKTELSPKQIDYLSKIQSSSQHLLGIINDILDFSKIEAGKLELETVDFMLDTVIDNVWSQLGEKAEKKDLKLIVEIDPDVPRFLCGDPLRLTQVLINYVNNAIKFTSSGFVSVRAHVFEAGESDILLRVEVQDTGIGMTKDDISQMFKVFQQADSSITRKYGGTGLGLAICKQLVNMMGGEVGVLSAPGHGSTFWFSVRLGLGEAPFVDGKAMDIKQADLSAIRGSSILLVEDNRFNQQVAREMLEDAGAIVCLANNGQEALDMLQQDRFDCVLMDVQMPVMNGLDATRRIRANPALFDMPVVAMTANVGKEDQTRCFDAGMNDSVAKPINPGMLFAVLGKCIVNNAKNKSMITHETNDNQALKPIDLAVLSETWGNRQSIVHKYTQMFVETIKESMIEINSALARKDFLALSLLGHSTKSSARMVGAKDLSNFCLELEALKDNQDLDIARTIVGKMTISVAIIVEYLEREGFS